MLASLNLTAFLDEVASQSPAPGGGSVAALSAALGTALTSMVCRLTLGKKKYAGVQKEIEAILAQSEELRKQCLRSVDEDTAAFQEVMTAYALPKDTAEHQAARTAAIQSALKNATRIPLQVLTCCAEGIVYAQTVAVKGNKNSMSDAGVAVLMLRAAGEGAALNIKTNLDALEDKEFAGQVARQTNGLLERIRTISDDGGNQLFTGS